MKGKERKWNCVHQKWNLFIFYWIISRTGLCSSSAHSLGQARRCKTPSRPSRTPVRSSRTNFWKKWTKKAKITRWNVCEITKCTLTSQNSVWDTYKDLIYAFTSFPSERWTFGVLYGKSSQTTGRRPRRQSRRIPRFAAASCADGNSTRAGEHVLHFKQTNWSWRHIFFVFIWQYLFIVSLMSFS